MRGTMRALEDELGTALVSQLNTQDQQEVVLTLPFIYLFCGVDCDLCSCTLSIQPLNIFLIQPLAVGSAKKIILFNFVVVAVDLLRIRPNSSYKTPGPGFYCFSLSYTTHPCTTPILGKFMKLARDLFIPGTH